MAQVGWSAKADVDPRPTPIDWGSAPLERVEPAGPPLRIGAYVTNISDIDLLQDQFSVEMLLWTTWAGDPQTDPSDQLMILNGIYDGDIQRFERVSHEQTAAGAWNLYRVRSAVVKRWRLQRYPFDEQMLHVQIGLADPLAAVNLDVADPDPFAVSLGLLIRRRSLLYVAPDFLGYVLAIGLCCMSLLITHSRDDLILAAVVSAGGNFVYIAGKLPVTAMAGFIGNLQLIIFLGILYVVAADELIDSHLIVLHECVSQVLRVLLLPSYVGITLLAIFMIIP